jgi:hypothetical protein
MFEQTSYPFLPPPVSVISSGLSGLQPYNSRTTGKGWLIAMFILCILATFFNVFYWFRRKEELENHILKLKNAQETKEKNIAKAAVVV